MCIGKMVIKLVEMIYTSLMISSYFYFIKKGYFIMKNFIYEKQMHIRGDEFDIDKVVIDLKPKFWVNKPEKAIWTSSEYWDEYDNCFSTDWENWTHMNEYKECDTKYEIVPSPLARILELDSDAMNLVNLKGDILIHDHYLKDAAIYQHELLGRELRGGYVLDFRKLRDEFGVDIIHMTGQALYKTRAFTFEETNDTPYDRMLIQSYGWDAESSCWINKDAILDVKKIN
jgi:hypothetical protein